METWIQKRLDELEFTHDDLRVALEKKGIKRVRETITGWANGKTITLLANPEQAAKLAAALQWSLHDMLIAAGYAIGFEEWDVTPEEMQTIKLIRGAKPWQRRLVVETVDFVLQQFNALNDDNLPPSKPIVQDE